MLLTHQETVPRFRSRNNFRLRPVNRIKHVVDIQGAVALGVKDTQILASTTDTPTVAGITSVETGCTINGIYLVVEVYGTSSGALSNIYMLVFKNPGNNLTTPTPNTVGANDDKRYVIHQEMVMVQKVTPSNPRTLFKGVIAIPKGYRRFGPADRLQVVFLAPGINFDFCLQCHYKEFR